MNLKLPVILSAVLSSAWMRMCIAKEMSEDLLEEMMDDNKFISAIYWAPNDDDELAVEYCVDSKWCDESKDYTFAKDVGQPGRVWETKEYEYNENVQDLDPDKFLRHPVAVDEKIKGLLCVPYTEDGKVKGVVELGLKKEKPVDEDVVEVLKEILEN